MASFSDAPVDAAVQMIASRPLIFYPILAAGAAAAALYFYREWAKSEIEGTTLNERVRGNVEPVADLFAKEPEADLKHGFHPIGRIANVLAATTTIKQAWFNDRDEDESQGIYIFKVRPRNSELFRLAAWFLVDVLLGIRKFTHLIVANAENVEIGSEIRLQKDTEFMERGGVYVQKSEAGNAFILETAFQDILDDSLETFGDIAEVIQQMNVQHAMNLAEIEKKMELEDQYGKKNTLNKLQG